MKVLSFDIGGTDIKYGVIENENFLYKNKMPTNVAHGQRNLLKRLEETTRGLQEQFVLGGVGVSVAGTIAFNQGKIISPPEDIPEFIGLDFKKFFWERFNLDCCADNDVNCFALAESKSGAGKNLKSFLTLTIGTGIGGGIIIDKKLWRGANFQGAEFGRIFLNEKKYETWASTAALVRRARQSGLNVQNGVDVFRLYDQFDEQAVALVQEFFYYVALGLANLWYIFDPEAIIIGGGISNRSQLAQELTDVVKTILIPDFASYVKIINAKHGNDGGMLGAYFNFMDQA